MNGTLKVKSSSTLPNRCQRNSTATRSPRLRIVLSGPAASSGVHTSCRWTPFAAAPDNARASSRRRQPETVAAHPRSVRGQLETVREATTASRQLPTVPDDEMAISDTSPSNRPRQLSDRQLSASEGAGSLCPFCRGPTQRCQCRESNMLCPLSRIGQFRTQQRMTVTDTSEADPVRRTSTGQWDTVPSVAPLRRRERDTVTDIAPANSTHRSVSQRLGTTHAAPARRRRHSVREPTTSQHSMRLRDSNAVDLSELRSLQLNRIGLISAPPLADNGNSDLYELLDRSVALSRFIRLEFPIRVPTTLIDPLVSAWRNVNLFTSEADEPGCMTEEEICRLPVRKVPNSAIPSQPCTICLKDYERGDVLRVMPCHHEFHQKCLDQWLAIKRNCPVCRNAL